MKHVISFFVVVVVGFLGWSPTLAFDRSQYIHLVSHRDVSGNLVVPPQWQKHSEVQSAVVPPTPTSHVESTSHHDEYKSDVTQHEKDMAPEALDDSVVKAQHEGSMEVTEEEATKNHVHSDPQAEVVTLESENAKGQDDIESHGHDMAQHDEILVNTQTAHESAMEAQGEDLKKSFVHEDLAMEVVGEDHGESHDQVVQKTSIPPQSDMYSFPNTHWGMSTSEVKNNEQADVSWELDAPILTAGEHRLAYKAEINGVEGFLTYAFENNRLRNKKYLFETTGIEGEDQVLLDYEAIKNWIIQNYGPPQSEEHLWVDELYRYAPELWGRALMRGHLTCVAEWDVDGTSIVLLLNGGEETVGLLADFTTKDIIPPTELVQVSSSFFDF